MQLCGSLNIPWHCPSSEREWKLTFSIPVATAEFSNFGPITSWQIDGERIETVTDFIFLGSKITADGDCSHEIKGHWLLGRKAMTNLDSILKSRDITLPTKVHTVKAMEVMKFQLSYFKILKMMLLKCCTQHANKFGKLISGHRTGKGQFHSNPEERQCQGMLELLHNCIHLTHLQSNTQNSPSKVSTVQEPWTSRYSSWI